MKSSEKIKRRLGKPIQYHRHSESTMSDHQIRAYLAFAYESFKKWSLYLETYLDLFATEDQATVKAKTHSLMCMCKYLIDRRGCSYKRVYENLIRQQGEYKMILEKKLLPLDTLLSFCCSISEVECGCDLH